MLTVSLQSFGLLCRRLVTCSVVIIYLHPQITMADEYFFGKYASANHTKTQWRLYISFCPRYRSKTPTYRRFAFARHCGPSLFTIFPCFSALTLKGDKASEIWDPEAKETDDYQGGHKLIIKQALLGPDAAEGEVNVLQVEAKRWPTWKKPVQIPVAVLKGGSSNNQVLLDLSFPDPPVTFSLAQGSGPVHVIGHHLIGSPIEEFEEMDEMEEEMLDDEESEEGAVSTLTIYMITLTLPVLLFSCLYSFAYFLAFPN